MLWLLFKQGHFVPASTHEYCTGANGRGMRRASSFENALNFNEIFCLNVSNSFKYQQKKKIEKFWTNFIIFRKLGKIVLRVKKFSNFLGSIKYSYVTHFEVTQLKTTQKT